ncbi:DUF5819 family protein [Actinoplanes sp. CA-252034]|uniref:DUF5819 family protein n=1 Tax=Actinoplanes sp. CA-252034 TaxID=3239906 RepID=UPI003D9936CD
MRQRYGELGEKPQRVIRGAVVGLCAAAALTHVLMLFLHVAPPNPVSQRYQAQIGAWITPYFEQNWLLFAPNPEAHRTQIFARSGWTNAAGERETSDWIDITAVDNAAVTHNAFPSRTNQSMLHRAWNAYAAAHGDDEVSVDEFSLLRAENLRNIAARRLAELSPQPFQVIRLRVVLEPIPAPGGTPRTDEDEPYTRLLPWWNVTSDGS